MTRKEEWIFLQTKMKDYASGKLKSKHYTAEQLLEKRKYFESQRPNPEFKIPEWRWLYEIKRIFELSDTFKKCPDWDFTRLEFILKFNL